MGKLTSAILLILLFLSCDRPECRNTNSIFDQFTPDKEEYKKELAMQMKTIGVNKLRYWLDRPIALEGKEFIEVYIQGQGLCAKTQLLVADKVKQKALGSDGGEGYRGAELKDVNIRISQDSTRTLFILEKVGKIID
jgi:hypothetical protein